MSLTPDHDQLKASSTSTLKPQCAVCKRKEAIYTCPRCFLRCCSAACSASHKKARNCSGERNKAAYVPMNKYTWGMMMSDYVFLEETSRRVGDWGKEIVRGGYMNPAAGARSATGKGRGGGPGKGKWTRTKRDVLKLQLEARDIGVELLPHGMERKKMNQSYWDFKKKTAFLTIEFKLHAPNNSVMEPPFRLLSPRNNLSTPLLDLVQTLLPTKKGAPEWAKLLVLPDADNPESFSVPHFVMPAQREVVPTMELFSHHNKPLYYRLDPTRPLSALLKGTRFVEFPTIEVHEEFNGPVIDAAGVVSHTGGQPRAKRRKLNKAVINGLLGDYGSGEEDNEGVLNVSSMLVEYHDSTGEDAEENKTPVDEESDENVNVDPTTLLQLLQEAKHRGQWTKDDDEVDWGESSEGEPH